MSKIVQILPPAIINVAVTNPDAGADWSNSFDAFSIYELISIRAQLATDANAASRRPILNIQDGGVSRYLVAAPVDQTASTTWQYCAAQYLGQPPVNTGSAMPIALPHGLTLSQSATISVTTSNIQVGDQWSNVVLRLRQWGQPLSV